MADYRVELDSYSGPLDLLLYLVRRHEIDLHDIPIATLTEQYLRHLRLMQQIDVELVGEFLVMAATLLEIKSALFVPRGDCDAHGQPATDAQHESDPRYELVQQLLAYKRFKDAAAELDRRRHQWARRYPYLPHKPGHDPADESAELNDIDLDDANVLELCQAYARVLETVGHKQADLHRVIYDDTPIALHAEDIIDRINRDGPMQLQDMFVGRTSRSEKIGLFLATLELIRQARVVLVQDQARNRIVMAIRNDETATDTADDPQAHWSDPQTGQIQYEWPSQPSHRHASVPSSSSVPEGA